MPYCVKCGAQLDDNTLFCQNCGTPVHSEDKPSTSATSAVGGLPDSGIKSLVESPKAQSYWIRRLVASFIDSIILSIVIAVIGALLSIPILIAGGFSNLGLFNLAAFPLVVGLFSIFYFPASEVYRGATLGKLIMGLKVTTLTGEKPDWRQAFIRNISKIYLVMLLLDVVVGLAIQMDYRQKFSDKYAGTIVVDK